MSGTEVRLQHLYDIGKILARFESVEQAVPEVLGLVNAVAPLRTAILMLDGGSEALTRTRTFAWRAEGVGHAHAAEAESRAKRAFSYWNRGASGSQRSARSAHFPTPVPPPLDPGPASCVVLPLVVHRGRVFGALQLEATGLLNEIELSFVNATVNQLGVAIDRAAAVAEKQAAAVAAQSAAELIAQVSAVLFSSLDYETTQTAVVRAGVPRLADICVLDELVEGRVRRTGVFVGDPLRNPDAAARLRAFEPESDALLRYEEHSSASAVTVFDSLEAIADRLGDGELLMEIGVQSMIIVPLRARGHGLGALTFAFTAPGRRYGERELSLARELGLRASIALDNARLYASAQRATQARQHIIAIVSHDLKNPLGTILMSTGLLLNLEATISPETMRKRVEVIRRSAQRMNRLLSDLLDITSIEMGHLSVKKALNDVPRIVTEAVDTHSPQAAHKGMALVSDLPPEGFELECDRDRVLQVLGNLIGNAIKFTPQGGTVTVSAQPRQGEVRFSVSDTGPGIAPEEAPHVFERYWQSKKTASLGSGLGLSISKGLVELHGGRIWVEPTRSPGACIVFTIPAPPTSSS